MEQPGTAGRFDLWGALTDEARAAFDAAGRPRSLAPGQAVYTQSDVGEVMFRIVRGEVRLSYRRADGRELVVYIMGQGQCLGVSTLIDGRGLPHTATARTKVVLHVVAKTEFERLRREYRSFDDALLRLLCQDIRLLSTHLAAGALDDLPEQVAHRLLELAGPGAGPGATVRLPQSELASMVGASRQTVNRLLRQFEQDGLVRLRYGTIELPDPEALRLRHVHAADA